ncbi:uncharacterized protein LOC130450909 [Diorhabda sublineata]|uniref:uncharacterized protein LOC130450909 n=1 Tax=Diorhabda sublineata TaxID=1163346 RepID=UPI0024E04D63|nr:uncharacterized protein LOC130450909 [Diorhabda sublineata]
MVSELCFIIVTSLVAAISGHGMMLIPPGRSSLWRTHPEAPINYNDNEVYCGGAYVQNTLNGQKCGVCGDRYDAPHPQDNENGGTYGLGIIVGTYQPGDVLGVLVTLTANHLGYFTYSLCELPDPDLPEPGEECFVNLLLEDGSKNFPIKSDYYIVQNQVVLPNITCPRCVLRWTYRTGNNWGVCENGTQGIGCGPQEHFRSCADIAILP